MLTAIDSFLKFLETGLNGVPPVHWQHAAVNDIDSGVPKMNALNVAVLHTRVEGSEEEVLVTLDLIGDSERQVWQWMSTVRNLLLESLITPEYDYATNPEAPVATGRMVNWKREDVGFQVIAQDVNYFHVNATFPISHVHDYTS